MWQGKEWIGTERGGAVGAVVCRARVPAMIGVANIQDLLFKKPLVDLKRTAPSTRMVTVLLLCRSEVRAGKGWKAEAQGAGRAGSLFQALSAVERKDGAGQGLFKTKPQAWHIN